MHGHRVAGLIAVAPEAEGMAQLVQRCRLHRRFRLAGADQHVNPRLQLPAALALNLQQLQQELSLGRIANGKQYPGLVTPVALNPGNIQKQPPGGIAAIKQPDQIGGPCRW